LIDFHNRSTKTLSLQQPLPSMLIRILFASRIPMKSALVNWLPWSVFMIWGVPYLAIASCSASIGASAVMVFDSLQARTRRLAQSITALR
jgi:hypothetical protein